MDKTKFSVWCDRVVAVIKSVNTSDWLDAISCARKESGEKPADESAQTLLEFVRGDEPIDCFEAGDSPTTYADHLLQEWFLFGPQGE